MSIHSVTDQSTPAVLHALFDTYLPTVADAKPDDIYAKYELLRTGWGSQDLVKGTQDQVRAIVLFNLQVITRRPDFGSFEIEIRSDTPPSVQLNALMIDGKGNTISFVPVRVWRTGDTYYACGNADFNDGA